MKNLINYHSDIHTLATQLEKLMKVINHSDPTAERMKHLLYEKYKEQMTATATCLKPLFSWSALLDYLVRLKQSDSFLIASEHKEKIMNKLIKDFEAEFISKHKLAEFAAPDPVDLKQKKRLQRIRKQIRNNRKPKEHTHMQHSVFEMMQYKNQQKTAKSSLDKLVRAFNRIDPQELDQQAAKKNKN